MKYFLFVFLILIVKVKTSGQSPLASVSAILEFKKSEYTIASSSNVKLFCKYIYKIYNEEGSHRGQIRIYTNDNQKLKSFKAILKDRDGKKISIQSKSDLKEANAGTQYNLYSDDKVNYTELMHYEFPYTVEYEYVLESSVFLGVNWGILEGYNLSTQSSELVVKAPKEIDIKVKAHKFPGTQEFFQEGNLQIITWKAGFVNAIPDEIYSPDYLDLFPYIFISPVEFKYDTFGGKCDTWTNLGKWAWQLMENKNELPKETLSKINTLTISEKDTLKKIKILYSYLQSTTRYISIQVGIGGFQPFSASEVDSKKYGDCKALSNYMRSLLAGIGVNSVYTLIGNGDERKIKYSDFPGVYQINHAILMVPLKTDTIWLECTSQNSPFGYIGGGNGNRQALGITENGGVVLRTPAYTQENSFQNIQALISLNKQGGMTCSANYIYSGTTMDKVIYLKSQDDKSQKKSIYESYPAKDLIIASYSIEETQETIPCMTFNINLEERRFMTSSGNVMMFTPNYLNRFNNPIGRQNRTNDIYISEGYRETDTVKFMLPPDFSTEYIPGLESVQSIFGKYKAEYHLKGKELTYIRSLTIHAGSYRSESYKELYDFFSRIQTLDRQKVILKE